ncbi:MAG TPA: TetR/AcrR family transcriptional regulator [Actinomycetota bacterium]
MLTIPESRPRAGQRRPRSVRTAILKAARRLYLAEGVEGVSARKIAREVGCSPTAIYLYYRSIADLLEHLRMEGHGLLAGHLRDASRTSGAIECLRAMGRAYHRFGRDHPAFYALMFSLRPAEMPGRAAVQREMQTLFIVRDVVAAGMAAGELRRGDATVVANALWAQVHGVTALAVSGLLFETAPGHDQDVLETVLESALTRLRP